MEINIEPLGPSHNRSDFDCGVKELNNFLKKYSFQNQKNYISKTFVAIGDGQLSAEGKKTVLGFYTLSTGQINFDELPEGTVALASGFNNDNQIIIKADPAKWQNASPSKKWYVLYHELGHDVLNLDHGEGGKMMFNYVDRDYSWDEWLNDKNYMFNSYKRNN